MSRAAGLELQHARLQGLKGTGCSGTAAPTAAVPLLHSSAPWCSLRPPASTHRVEERVVVALELAVGAGARQQGSQELLQVGLDLQVSAQGGRAGEGGAAH